MKESFPQLPSAWHSFTNSYWSDNFSEDSLINSNIQNSPLWDRESISSDLEVIVIMNKLNDVVTEQNWDINKFHSAISNLSDLIDQNQTMQESVPEYLGKFGNKTLNEAIGKILHSHIDETLWNVGEFIINYPTALSVLPASIILWRLVKGLDAHFPMPTE